MAKTISVSLFFILFVSLSSSFTFAVDECRNLLIKARRECDNAKSSCSQVNSCKTFRAKCEFDLTTEEGCKELQACAQEHSPVYRDQRCRYKWWGNSEKGQCYNANLSVHTVSYMCPGFQGYKTNHEEYMDKEYNCQGHINYWQYAVKSCKEAAVKFYKTCPELVTDLTFVYPESCLDEKLKVPQNNP